MQLMLLLPLCARPAIRQHGLQLHHRPCARTDRARGDPSGARRPPKVPVQDAWPAHGSAQQQTHHHGPLQPLCSEVLCRAWRPPGLGTGREGEGSTQAGQRSGTHPEAAAPWCCQAARAYGELAGICDRICKVVFLCAKLIMEATKRCARRARAGWRHLQQTHPLPSSQGEAAAES